jgi:hypothetical protein
MKPLVEGVGGGPAGPRGRSDDDSVGRVGGVLGTGGPPEATGGPPEATGGVDCSGVHDGSGFDHTVRPAAK